MRLADSRGGAVWHWRAPGLFARQETRLEISSGACVLPVEFWRAQTRSSLLQVTVGNILEWAVGIQKLNYCYLLWLSLFRPLYGPDSLRDRKRYDGQMLQRDFPSKELRDPTTSVFNSVPRPATGQQAHPQQDFRTMKKTIFGLGREGCLNQRRSTASVYRQFPIYAARGTLSFEAWPLLKTVARGTPVDYHLRSS